MTEATTPDHDESTDERRRPDTPATALLPGIGLLVAGLWILTDGGPVLLGLSFLVVGLTCTLIGSLASGIAWGLDLHAHRRG